MKPKPLTLMEQIKDLRFRLKACDARRRVLLDVLSVVGCLDKCEGRPACDRSNPCVVCAALAKEDAMGAQV